MNDNLFQITALSFEKYMLLNGWFRDYNFKNKNTMVFKSAGKTIAIPASEKFDDFYFTIERMLKNLELYLGKNSSEIIKEIITSYYDRLEFRIQSDFVTDGKLPLGYAADCIEGLRNLVLYSSCAEQKAQPVCLKPSNRSRDLMNNFKLAQTEIGSFIINIDTEVVDEKKEQFDLDVAPAEYPLEHRVVQRIFTAISQINDVAEDRKSVTELVNNAYFDGITANMCDALLRLKADEVEIDATIRYASALTKRAGMVEKIVLKPKHFYVLDEVSKKYREVVKYEDISLKGYVGEMKKELPQRSIVLLTIVHEKLRRVHMELSDSDYKIANDAHMSDRQIEVFGELDMSSPKKWVLNDPSGIKLIE